MITDRDYQRKHLRAPFKYCVLYVDDDFAFKARAVNISEGGMLLDQVPHFPEPGQSAPLLISLPQYPLFKNFSLERLKSFNDEILKPKVLRLECEVIRKFGEANRLEAVFSTKVGARFLNLNPSDKKAISAYVNVFAGNLIYLQILLDNMNSDDEGLEKVRELSKIMGYEPDMKISQLRKEIHHDYKSLQWL